MFPLQVYGDRKAHLRPAPCRPPSVVEAMLKFLDDVRSHNLSLCVGCKRLYVAAPDERQPPLCPSCRGGAAGAMAMPAA